MLRLPFFAMLWLSCGTPQQSSYTLNLSRRLGPGEVLAGEVTREAALFGGSSAEGELGDFKMYNDRVRFIIQGVRSGGYYVEYGGGILDADIVRAQGQPGMDMLDEHTVMAGLGRLMEAKSIEVINDGSNGKAAVLRVKGESAPLQLLTGAVESLSIVPPRSVHFTHDYTLQPDSWLLELTTTLEWDDQPTTISPGDLAFMGEEVAHTYFVGSGLNEGPTEFGWASGIGQRNEVAFAIMHPDGQFVANSMLQAISSLAPLITGTTEPVTLSSGDTHTWSRHIGVARDLATLTDAWYAARDEEVQTLGGSVTSSGDLVAGAQVHILDADGAPLTMAITDTSGTWTADIPADQDALVQATGRGTSIHYDLPQGAGWYGPYAADGLRQAALNTLSKGARPQPFAEGYGVSSREVGSADTPLALTTPGTLEVQIDDGGPAVVRIDFIEADSKIVDDAIVPSRPSGAMGWLYIKDGAGSLPVEPGTYEVIIHRGVRYSYHSEQITIESGETTEISAALNLEAGRPGIYTADPHSHAAPSGDGGIPMEARLVNHAAHGIDIHFGTDHDHIADYRVLLQPLQLEDRLASIVATEVSPVLRGHFNAYPLQEDRTRTNNGALLWFRTWLDWLTTSNLFDTIRGLPSDGEVLVQANHPVGGGGLFGAAEYSPEDGSVGTPENWSSNFSAVEVLNGRHSEDYVSHYMDMVCRGLSPTPVGVSDSHSHRGSVGQAFTYVPIPIDQIGDLEPDHIRDAWRENRTVPSTGPLIEARVDGEWAPGQTFDGAITVKLKVWAPEWMSIDTVNVYKNMELIDTIDVDGDAPLHLSTSVDLSPAADAVYFFEVTGSEDMSPVYPGAYPWALTAGIKVDTNGGKWKSPLPSITGG